MTLFSIAGNNIKRELFRSTAIALCVAVVAGTLFSVALMTESADAGLKRVTSRLGADLIVVPAGGQADFEGMAKFLAGDPGEFTLRVQSEIVDAVRAIQGVKEATPLLFHTSSENASAGNPGPMMVGYDPQTDFTVSAWLKETEKLSEGRVFAGSRVSGGDGIRLRGRACRIAGRLETTGLNFVDNSLFLPLPAAWDVTGEPGRISAVMVRTDAGYNAQSLHALASMIENRISGVKVFVTEEMILSLGKHFSVLGNAILLTGIVIWIITLIMIGVIFSMTMNERQREMGLLRAMGAAKSDVFRLSMLEASALSGLGGGFGVLAGGIFLYVMNTLGVASSHYLLPEYPRLAVIIILCMLLAFVSGTGATLYPALRSSLMEPQEAINKGA